MNDPIGVSGLRKRSHFPTVVSFYGGDQYYYDAAKRLRSDCERLGLPHHIEEIDTSGMKWPDICRLKIRFYRDAHRRFESILWVDVDNRILDVPAALEGCRADLAGFVGRRQYIRDYDPYQVTRFWIPSILYFGPTERAARFLDELVELEAKTQDEVTDDWVLHEAWSNFPEQMNVMILAPDLLARESDVDLGSAVFFLGDSGHVSEYRDQVVQHRRKLQDVGLRGQALAATSIDAMRAGRRTEASVLAHYAYRCLPDDSEAAVRLSNYLSVNGDAEHADEVLRDFVMRHPEDANVREALVRRHARRGEFDRARALAEDMVLEDDARLVARGAALGYEIGLEERAAAQREGLASRPTVWWSRTPFPGHFAEVLKPWVVEQIVGRTPIFGPRERSLLTGEGRISHVTQDSIVWGGGIRNEDEKPGQQATYLAVRGPRTRRMVQASGGDCPEIYGDPARLLPDLIPISRPTRRRHYLGLLRSARDQSVVVQLEGIHEIDALGVAPQVLEHVVDEIVNCHGVLTTSLTGLVTAHAYGVPARWCVFGRRASAALSDGEEFRDYFEAVGMRPQVPLDLSAFDTLGRDLIKEIPKHEELPALDDRFVQTLRERFTSVRFSE